MTVIITTGNSLFRRICLSPLIFKENSGHFITLGCFKNRKKHCLCSPRGYTLLFKMFLMQDTGCLGLVRWDDPEGWYGEGGGRGVLDGEHVYTCGGFILIYGNF